MVSKTKRSWVIDADGNLIELEDGEPVPDGCTVHVRFNDSAGRADAYIRDARGRAYLDYCDRLAGAWKRKATAQGGPAHASTGNVRDGKPDPRRWYKDWLFAHGYV